MSVVGVPSNYKLKYSPELIQQNVERVGNEVGHWLSDIEFNLDSQILALPVMRGALFFFADLIRKIPYSVEIAPVRVQAYEGDQNKLKDTPVQIRMEDISVKGRTVLVVDDICDSGKTLSTLVRTLFSMGAEEVKTAVLIKRDLEGCLYQPDYIGFEYRGDEWMVGYGMDDKYRWRNLAGIYAIE